MAGPATRTADRAAERWGGLHQVLHWVTAALVIAQVIVGFAFVTTWTEEGGGTGLFSIHIVLGAAILLLTIIRLVWRLTHPVPAMPNTLTRPETRLARANHYGLYAVLFYQPITGALTVAAGNGIFPFAAPAATAATVFSYLHAFGVAALILLLWLHIMAALRHEFLLKDNTLRRMTPLRLRPTIVDRKPPPGPGIP